MEKIEDRGTDAAHSPIVQPRWRKLDITMMLELRFQQLIACKYRRACVTHGPTIETRVTPDSVTNKSK